LVNRSERNFVVIRDKSFRAVSVMRVKVPNGNPLDASLDRVESCQRDISEIAKSHRLFTQGVVPRRAHQAKGAFARDGCARCLDCGTCRTGSVLEDVRISRAIRIEIGSLLPDTIEVLGGVGSHQLFTGSWRRRRPNPRRVIRL
jgi:hypothetical protein